MTRKLSMALALLLSACTTGNDFVYRNLNPEGHNTRLPVTFELALEDTVRTADLYICGRFNHRYSDKGLSLRIEFRSPTGRRYGEDLFLPLINGDQIRTSCGYDQEWCYRTGVRPRPDETGKWKVSVFFRPEKGEKTIKNIYGIGISTKYERKR